MALHCPRPCPICPHQSDPNRIVNSDGSDYADTLMIGEGPGYWEDRRSIPFIGKTGKEFNENYLPKRAKLSRPQIKLVNSVSCFFDGDNQTKEQARECAPVNVKPLVERMPNLKFVVFMGGVASSLLDWAVTIPETGEPVGAPNLIVDHGLPVNHGRPVLFFGKLVRAICVIHPAAGLHQTSAMTDIFEDFDNIHRWRNGWTGPRDLFTKSKLRYYEIRDEQAELAYEQCRGAEHIAIDTELSSKRKPWSIQGAVKAGEAWLIRDDQKLALEAFQQAIWEAREILIHNAKFDLLTAAGMNVHIPIEKVTDTMIYAYTQGKPQALKTLARRLCGMEMQEWEDVVWPYFEDDWINWLITAEDVVKTVVEAEEAGAKQLFREMAEEEVPADAKRRNQLVNKRVKEMMQELADEKLDWWRPPLEDGVDKNGKAIRRRGVGYEKMIGRILGDHARSRDQGNKGVDFGERWFGDDEKEDKPGTLGRLPLWAVQKARAAAGPYPRMGLDQAPFAEALYYSCRDPDATIRVWKELST